MLIAVVADAYELVIVGGGFAGQCFARDLLRRRPRTRLAIVDRRALPGDPDHRGVGESTSEIAGWYLRERLGLGEHLEREQIVKFGLRFWLRDPGASAAIAERIELGPIQPRRLRPDLELPQRPHAYQLHRGRLEHRLALDNLAAGVELLANHELLARAREGDGWTLELRSPSGALRRVRANWLIDAGGSPGLLADGLGGRVRPSEHEIVAAWWWVERRVDPAAWTTDARVAARTDAALRWRSTHHLVGEGYWIWLIPLADGSTSVGLVVDPRGHPLADAAAVRALLEAREPELLATITPVPDALHWWRAAGRTSVEPIGPRRLATGAALGFLDPLYSAGHDLSALIHELALPALVEALERGDDLPEPIRAGINRSFTRIAEHYERLYLGAYAVFGDPRVAVAKFVWDQLIYFAWPCALAFSGRLGQPQLGPRLRALGDRAHHLNDRVQTMLRRWALRRRGNSGWTGPSRAVDQSRLPSLMARFWALDALGQADEATSLAELARSIDTLERFALAYFALACRDLDLPIPDEPLDPYALGLDPGRWAADGLFGSRRGRRPDPALLGELALLEGGA